MAETLSEGIIGFASCGRRSGESFSDYEGELYAIYLSRECQCRGIGTRLFKAAKRELLEQDVSSMLLWVLALNTSRRFYEALGGTLLGSQEIEIGGAKLEEVAYGWLDMRKPSTEKLNAGD